MTDFCKMIDLQVSLPDSVTLNMIPIPEGPFLMGSPENEPERFADEEPQHQVSLASFF